MNQEYKYTVPGRGHYVTWVDADGIAHSSTVEGAARFFKDFYDEWPGGLEELHAEIRGLKAKADHPYASDATTRDAVGRSLGLATEGRLFAWSYLLGSIEELRKFVERIVAEEWGPPSSPWKKVIKTPAPAATVPADEREAFESWSKRTNQGYGLTPMRSGKMSTYENDLTEHAYRGFFHGFRAALAAPAAPQRTDAQIVEQTEELAHLLMLEVYSREPSADTLFRNADDPRSRHVWQLACKAQEILTATDPENAVAEVDDAAPAAQPETRQELAKRLIDDVCEADAIATAVCRTVAELPDRNSPEGWPEAMIVTNDELHQIVREAIFDAPVAQAAPQAGEDARPVHQVFHSDGTWEDVDAEAFANCEANGKETRTLYAAAQQAVQAAPAVPKEQLHAIIRLAEKYGEWRYESANNPHFSEQSYAAYRADDALRELKCAIDALTTQGASHG